MMVLIVEYVPYIAFTAAAGLVAWVTFDVLRGRKRVSAPAQAQDSGRGLAGPAEPLKETVEAPVKDQVETEELSPPEELELPVSQAREIAPEPEMAMDDTAVDEPVELAAEGSDEASEDFETAGSEFEAEPVVAGNSIPVRRDPSVRVFDTAVAPSERKVMSSDD